MAVACGVLVAVACVAAPATGRADDLRDGNNALRANQLDRALAAFERAASQGSAEGRAGVGQVWLKRHQYGKAMAAFQAAQKMDPNLALPYWGQAEVMRQEGHCAQAVPLFQKATDLDRKFPEAQLGLGECLVATGQHERGVAALREGLKWSDWKARFLVALGNAEMGRDSLRDAGVYFTQAREAAPNEPGPHRALGDFYLKRGIPSLAIPEYQAAIQRDTSDVELRFALAQALFNDKRYQDALEAYRAVVARDSDYAPGQLGLGQLYYLSGAADPRRYADALPYLRHYCQLSPEDPKGWSYLGRAEYFIGLQDKDDAMKKQALVAMARADSLGDTSKEMFTLMGRAYADQHQWDQAVAAFQKGDPTDRDLLLVAQLYVIQGARDSSMFDRADSLYSAIVGRDSTASEGKFALNELGKLKFRLKQYPEAIDLLQRRIGLDPDNDEAYYYIGLSYKEMKEYQKSLAALRTAADLSAAKQPRFDRYFWLGILYAQVDSTQQARAAFQRAVELDPENPMAAIAYRQLGFYKLLEKKWNDATEQLEKAVSLNDKDVQSWVWLGQGYQNAGNRSKALQAYLRALELDPRQPEALKGRKVLESQGRGAP